MKFIFKFFAILIIMSTLPYTSFSQKKKIKIVDKGEVSSPCDTQNTFNIAACGEVALLADMTLEYARVRSTLTIEFSNYTTTQIQFYNVILTNLSGSNEHQQLDLIFDMDQGIYQYDLNGYGFSNGIYQLTMVKDKPGQVIRFNFFKTN